MGAKDKYAGPCYAYDGLSRRVRDGTGDAYFDTAWQDVEDRAASGQVSGQQVWSPVYVDAMVEQDRDTDADGTPDRRLYPTQDANWNVTAVLGGTGTVLVRYDYTAYGSRTVLDPATYAVTADPVNFRQGFQGGTYEAALPDLILFRNRTYDTLTMRWVEGDPLGPAAYPTEGLNLYTFVDNEPGSYSDPIGLAKHWHHDYPQGVFKPAILQALGLNTFDINALENGTMLDRADHLAPDGVHGVGPQGGLYNKVWGDWVLEKLQRGQPVTEDDLRTFQKQLRVDPRFKDQYSRGSPATKCYPGTKKIDPSGLSNEFGMLGSIAGVLAAGTKMASTVNGFGKNGTAANNWFKNAIDPNNSNCDSLSHGPLFQNMKEEVKQNLRSGAGAGDAVLEMSADIWIDKFGNLARDLCFDRHSRSSEM